MPKKAAKERGKQLHKTIEWWFRSRYNLPPTDPRFLDCTLEDMEAEFWAAWYEGRRGEDEIEDEDFDIDEVIAGFGTDDWEEVSLK